MSTQMNDDHRRADIARRTRAGLEEDLEDLRDELSHTLRDYEGHVRGVAREVPDWASCRPKQLEGAYRFSVEEAEQPVCLGPRIVAEMAADVEGFVREWLPRESEADQLDYTRPKLREFADEADDLLGRLDGLKDRVVQEGRETEETLDRWLDADLNDLEERREHDIEALEDLVGEGEVDAGHDVREERARLWEEQRRQADHLMAIFDDLFALVDEGVDYAVDGLDELRGMVQRACEGMEGAYPATGDYLPGGVLERVKHREEADAEVTEGSGSGTQPMVPGEQGGDQDGEGAGEMLRSSDPGEGSETEHGPPGGPSGAPEGAPASTGEVTEHSPKQASPEDAELSETAPAEVAGVSDSGRFLRVGPEDRALEGSEAPADDVPPQPETEPLDPGQRPDSTGPEDAPTDSTATGAEREPDDKPALEEAEASSETRLDLAAEAEAEEPPGEPGDASGGDGPDGGTVESEPTGSPAAADAPVESTLEEETTSPDRPAARESAAGADSDGRAAPEAGDARADEEADAPASSDSQPAPAAEVSIAGGDDAPTAASPDEPLQLQCIRIRSEWGPVNSLEWLATLGPPALFVLGILGLGGAYLAGVAAAPNPVEAWPWIKPTVAVAVVWLLCAPLVMGWKPRWRGWRFDFVHEIDHREESDLVVEDNRIAVGDTALELSGVPRTSLYRWGEPEDDVVGWLFHVETATGQSLDFVASAADVLSWESSAARFREPPQDAWQMTPEGLETLRRRF